MDNQEVEQKLRDQIKDLLQDQVLDDLDANSLPTEEELDSLIAVEQGQAYQITISRDPLPSIPIIVRQSSTVLDIKKLVRRKVEALERKEKSIKRRSISWRYIWKSHCLMFGAARLLNDKAVIAEYSRLSLFGVDQDVTVKTADMILYLNMAARMLWDVDSSIEGKDNFNA